MITTKKVKLTAKAYFRILISRQIKNYGWFVVWIWVLAILLLIIGDSGKTAWSVLVFAYPLFVVWYNWRHAHAENNKIYLLEQYYEIDKDKIKCILDEDTHSSINVQHIIRVEVTKKYFLIFVSEVGFIHLPLDAFQSESDLDWFKREVLAQIET